MLPVGSIVADKFANDAERKYVPSDAMPDGWMGMDIGGITIEKFSNVIEGAKTIIWNGPMGVFEFENFAQGTKAIAEAVAKGGRCDDYWRRRQCCGCEADGLCR